LIQNYAYKTATTLLHYPQTMPPFAIAPCSIDDGHAIAHVNVSALWTDPTWVAMWPGKTLEYVIGQSARRTPHMLLVDTAHRRHQKAIDVETGAVVGYVRWCLPKLDDVDTSGLWPEALVPHVSDKREREAEREYDAADYSFDRSLDELDKPADEMMDKILDQKKYIGKYPPY
jgi:hypothetical protein